MNYLIRGTEQWDEEHRHLLAMKLSEKLDATYYRLSSHQDWDTVAIYNYGPDDECNVYANCINDLFCIDIHLQDLEIQ